MDRPPPPPPFAPMKPPPWRLLFHHHWRPLPPLEAKRNRNTGSTLFTNTFWCSWTTRRKTDWVYACTKSVLSKRYVNSVQGLRDATGRTIYGYDESVRCVLTANAAGAKPPRATTIAAGQESIDGPALFPYGLLRGEEPGTGSLQQS
jgi:hypothetical protein